MILNELCKMTPRLMGTTVLVCSTILSIGIAYRIAKSHNDNIAISKEGLKIEEKSVNGSLVSR